MSIVVTVFGGWYYFILNDGTVEKTIYYDKDIEVGFVKITNDELLGFERLEFEKLNNETGPDKEYEMIRLFTDDFRDADFTSAGACLEEKITNGGYEIYITTDIDQTVNSEYTLENVDWQNKISRAEGAPGTEEVEMIDVQGFPFMYHRTSDGNCWNFAKIEGWVTPNHKLEVSIHYYNDSALEDFEKILRSLKFINLKGD